MNVDETFFKTLNTDSFLALNLDAWEPSPIPSLVSTRSNQSLISPNRELHSPVRLVGAASCVRVEPSTHVPWKIKVWAVQIGICRRRTRGQRGYYYWVTTTFFKGGGKGEHGGLGKLQAIPKLPDQN
jgi:hypothetical protein